MSKIYLRYLSCDMSCDHMQMVKVVLPKMLDKKKGVIVNLSSSAGSLMLPMMTVYASTKVNVIFLSISIIQGLVTQFLSSYFSTGFC